MDVIGWPTTDGATVGIWGCNGELNQWFTWGPDGTIRVSYEGRTWCLDGATWQIVINTCSGASSQRWEAALDGLHIRMVGTELCMDVPNWNTAWGTRLGLAGCWGATAQQWDARPPDHATCGVSFTAVVTAEDALLAAYGIPATTDTVRVCETWTGSDYVVDAERVGVPNDAWHDADSTQTVHYAGGQITGSAADGGPVGDPIAVGPTAFDFMSADQATRQASYDSPYYGVYATDGSGGCADPEEIVCTAGETSYARTHHTALASADTGKKFAKHGLKRRGVRALVDDKQEVGRSPEGHRKFRKVVGDTEVTLTLDPQTELLVGEETKSPRGTTRAKHTWKRIKGAHVRARTEVEDTEVASGQTLTNRTSIQLLDVTAGRQ